MARVILMIRRTKDYKPWEDLDVIEQRKQWWRTLFRIPYVEFRQELSKIAATNYDKLGADKIYYTIDDFVEEQHLIQPDEWVLPLDDDDWLCNGICETIKTLTPAKNFIVWRGNVRSMFKSIPPTYLTLEKVQHSIFPKLACVGMVDSCCYAMRGEIATYDNLINHTSASTLEQERECVDHLGLEACYLHMPCSQSALARLITSPDIMKASVDEVQKLDENLLAHRPEFVANLRRMKELFAQL